MSKLNNANASGGPASSRVIEQETKNNCAIVPHGKNSQAPSEPPSRNCSFKSHVPVIPLPLNPKP